MSIVSFCTAKGRPHKRVVHVPLSEMERAKNFGRFADSIGVELPALVVGNDDGKEIYVSRFVMPDFERTLISSGSRDGIIGPDVSLVNLKNGERFAKELYDRDFDVIGSEQRCLLSDHYIWQTSRVARSSGEKLLGSFHNHPLQGDNAFSYDDVNHAFKLILNRYMTYFIGILYHAEELQFFGFSRYDANPYKHGKRKIDECSLYLSYLGDEELEEMQSYMRLHELPTNKSLK